MGPSRDDVLRRMAQTTHGEFFNIPTATKLTAVYRNLGSSIGLVTEQQEVTVAFVGAALALLVSGGGLSFLWFDRFP